VLTAVNDAARRLRRWPTAIIDRGSARRWWNSGRDEETALWETRTRVADGKTETRGLNLQIRLYKIVELRLRRFYDAVHGPRRFEQLRKR
jgi:hypothetical protein